MKFYNILFLGIGLLVFSYFIFTNRTFIYEGDGFEQHYKALIYYGEYLRNIAKSFITEHSFSIPNWDFYIGEGADVFTTFQYYVIGDPLAVLSIFVPTKCMYIFYNLLILVRLYLAGLFFILLCLKIGNKNKYGILAGTLSYVFCFWALYNANGHPYFLNPLIYFPLIILGVEKIINEERPYLLIFSVFIAALSNFYYFYVIAIFTAIYTIVRLIVKLKKDIKKICINIGKIAMYSIIGILLASVIFIPISIAFLSDTRMESGHIFYLIYPLHHYSRLPAIFISPSISYWLILCTTVPSILAMFLLFKQKKCNTELKVLYIISFVIILIPACGQILNGMSYMSNRWSWAYAVLSSYTLVRLWENLINIDEKDYRYLVKCMIIYLLICFIFRYSRSNSTFMRNCNWIFVFNYTKL